MALSAIFRFENLDSTKDLNSRFAGLFQRGIYEGGLVKSLGSTSYAVTVEPFKAMSADGMGVISTENITVTLPSLGACYVIMIARYNIGSDPTITLKAVPEDSVETYVEQGAIKFALVVNGSVQMLSEDFRDEISPVGREHYKGIYNSASEAAEANNFVVGDWFFVRTATDSFQMAVWTGSEITLFGSLGEITNLLQDHIENIVNDFDKDDNFDGDWDSPRAKVRFLDENKAKEEQYGSYHISINKWFSSEKITRKWEVTINPSNNNREWNNTDNATTTLKANDYATLIEGNGERTPSLENENTIISSSDIDNPKYDNQRPTNDNKFITQNYPLLPNFAEKYGMAGNLFMYGVRPSPYNRFVVAKTPFASYKTKTAGNETAVGGYYYYKLTDNEMLYVGDSGVADLGKRALNYISFDLDVGEGSTISTLDGVTVVKGSSHTQLSSADMNTEGEYNGRGFLKVEDYYLRVSHPLKLKVGSTIGYYEHSNIDVVNVPAINKSIEEYKYIVSLRAGNLKVDNNTIIGGNLDVTGTSIFRNTVQVAADVTVNSGASVSNGLEITSGKLTISSGTMTVNSGNMVVTGNTNVTGTLTARNSLESSDKITVNGTTSVTGNASATQNLAVTGTITANNSYESNGKITVTGTSTIGGSTTTSSNLAVTGSVTANNGYESTGKITTSGVTQVGGNTTTTQNLVVTGSITANNGYESTSSIRTTGSTNISGDASATQNLVVTGSITSGNYTTGSTNISGSTTANSVTSNGGTLNLKINGTLTSGNYSTGTTSVSGSTTVNSVDKTSASGASVALQINGTLTSGNYTTNTTTVIGATNVASVDKTSASGASVALRVNGTLTANSGYTANGAVTVGTTSTLGSVTASTLSVTGGSMTVNGTGSAGTISASGSITSGGNVTASGFQFGNNGPTLSLSNNELVITIGGVTYKVMLIQ